MLLFNTIDPRGGFCFLKIIVNFRKKRLRFCCCKFYSGCFLLGLFRLNTALEVVWRPFSSREERRPATLILLARKYKKKKVPGQGTFFQ
jgi:hypothetical protein